jgi:hypothetical protein
MNSWPTNWAARGHRHVQCPWARPKFRSAPIIDLPKEHVQRHGSDEFATFPHGPLNLQSLGKRITDRQLSAQLPTLFPISMVDAGGLIAYGTSLLEEESNLRRTVAQPSDLQPRRIIVV